MADTTSRIAEPKPRPKKPPSRQRRPGAEGEEAARGRATARRVCAPISKRSSAKKLTEQFGYNNPMQVPTLEKVVINMGIGEASTTARRSIRPPPTWR